MSSEPQPSFGIPVAVVVELAVDCLELPVNEPAHKFKSAVSAPVPSPKAEVMTRREGLKLSTNTQRHSPLPLRRSNFSAEPTSRSKTVAMYFRAKAGSFRKGHSK